MLCKYFNLKTVLISAVLLASSTSTAQKKKISSETYDEWFRIENTQQSSTGNWITYETSALEGDGALHVYGRNASLDKTFQRGKMAKIHNGEAYIAFIIKPQHDSIRKLKLNKVKKDKFPKDTLAVYWTGTDSAVFLSNVKSFKISKEGDWMAHLSNKDLRPESKKKKKKKKKKKGPQQIQTTGQTLTLFNPITNESKNIHRVKNYTFNKTGSLLAYTTSKKGDKDTISLHIIKLEDMSITTLAEDKVAIEKMTFDFDGSQLLYFTTMDTNKVKNYELAYWQNGLANGKTIVDSTTKGMMTQFTPSNQFSAYFSRNGKSIFFGTTKIQRDAPKDTLLETEKARVDIWASQDLKIQPEQLKTAKKDRYKAYQAVYHIEDKKLVQLANEDLESVRTIDHGNAPFGMGMDSKPHQRERTWAFPWKSDYYWVDFKSGKKTLIKEALGHGGSLAPSGKYFVWYNGNDSTWMSKDMISKEEKNLSSALNTVFAKDVNGMPFVPFSESPSGWAKIDGEEYYVVRDYYDLWLLHPNDPSKTFSLTGNEGKYNNMRYYLLRTEYDSTYLSLDRAFVKGINDETKNESIHEIITSGSTPHTSLLLSTEHQIISVSKAKESDAVILRKMNLSTYPELELTNINFESPKMISNTNPQQDEYNWATVEFVEWKAYDSTELRGLLYKPEDFDPNKKYPMIVYFYEMYQDNIHRHLTPKPTYSSINFLEFASNDYLVFVPDVRYEEGHPAKGAYNCIVSGTEYLVNKYSWVDSTKLGLQGQSWGGYQTAQLITMTNKYHAAMAGAPVSNMFSAFGGIRWGSGLSRMFQYERYQSRIGYTIWERPDLYIENSPLFGLPNVETPLLIMHNDNDGAVPWYQGIELYMGLRRLDKTVWMVNYNNDEHNLRKLPNRRDLSVRMKQFFDHYLQDAPPPSWMKNGLPAVDKGIENGFELEK
jgi:dipeptidyl aminopeptidase/acylaminoacyl peptidase